ncbi:MAG: UMP kinase [Patescibacteria group bacterium]
MQKSKHSNSLAPSTLVISVGGSIVVPDKINHTFLKAFKTLIEKHLKLGWKFVIVVGGGGTARSYQTGARKVGMLVREDLDWIGIHSTRLNGHLMRTIFRNSAHPIMFKDPTIVPKKWKQGVLVAAGWKPGWSTDYVATRIAKRIGAGLVVNLSNIDYLYNKDPNKFKDAMPICDISWKEFRKMVGNRWDPGMNVPFDPVASRLAHQSKIKVVLANGTDIKNLDELLLGKSFKGTVIQ